MPADHLNTTCRLPRDTKQRELRNLSMCLPGFKASLVSLGAEGWGSAIAPPIRIPEPRIVYPFPATQLCTLGNAGVMGLVQFATHQHAAAAVQRLDVSEDCLPLKVALTAMSIGHTPRSHGNLTVAS